MLLQSTSGDIWQLQLQKNIFSYQLHLMGKTIENVQSFQSQLALPNQVHLCLLDINQQLSYHQWNGTRWDKIQIWPETHQSFQFTLDTQDRFHLITHLPNSIEHHSYDQKKWSTTELPLIPSETILLKVFPWQADHLILIYKKSQQAIPSIYYRIFSNKSFTWSDENSLISIPYEYQNLDFWLSSGTLYLTYYTSRSRTNILNLVSMNSSSRIIFKHSFPDLALQGSPSILTLSANDLILLSFKKNALIYWRSTDQGTTWKTQVELPCPWPLKLAPIFNYKQEITPFIELQGFYDLNLLQPGILETKKLLSLSPYGLW